MLISPAGELPVLAVSDLSQLLEEAKLYVDKRKPIYKWLSGALVLEYQNTLNQHHINQQKRTGGLLFGLSK
ncbi:hypothetical protein RLOatenuis_7770 [Rickettsiales bacterium]|nr:hypothetical protein RLOatenuis_7770 [Rickettsiales bacterium]